MSEAPRLPPIPEPVPTIESIGLTVRALMHAMDILSLNAQGVSKDAIFARADEFAKLKAEFEAYKKAHP